MKSKANPTPAPRPGIETGAALLDTIEVARLLGVFPNTWRKRVSLGTAPLPHCRMGNRMYYRAADVRHFIRKGIWPARVKFRGLKPSE